MNMKRMLSIVVLAMTVGSAVAMTVDEAKAFMAATRTRFLSAKSYHIEYTATAKGIPTESQCWIRRDAKKGVAILNESQTKLFGFPMPKLSQLATGGKVYLISAIAPNRALHLKFADGEIADDVFASFFSEHGTVKPVSDAKDRCVIQFTPSAAELVQMGLAAASAARMMPGLGNAVPTSFRYTFLKPSKDISEIVGLNERGEETLKVSVAKLELDAKIEESRFVLPKDCKVIDLKSAAEAAKAVGGGLLPKRQ